MPKKKPPPKQPENDQHERFLEAARQAEASDDGALFEEVVKVVAKQKPKSKTGKSS